jgi:hypothetical protein
MRFKVYSPERGLFQISNKLNGPPCRDFQISLFGHNGALRIDLVRGAHKVRAKQNTYKSRGISIYTIETTCLPKIMLADAPSALNSGGLNVLFYCIRTPFWINFHSSFAVLGPQYINFNLSITLLFFYSPLFIKICLSIFRGSLLSYQIYSACSWLTNLRNQTREIDLR